LSGGANFCLPFFFAGAPDHALPSMSWQGWGAGAPFPIAVVCPTDFPAENPAGKPPTVPLVVVVACPSGVPARNPTGKPTAAPPGNAWGLTHVGFGGGLARGGRSNSTTGPHLATRVTGGGFPSITAATNHAMSALTPVSAACGNRGCCCHGNDVPSGLTTHFSHASAQSTLPCSSRRTRAGMVVMPYLAINANVRAFIPTSLFVSCPNNNHGMSEQ
jgi:hypothetical protein